MEIDLREIQALHARYAREPVVIDLESQVRARPAPLLLAHDPAVRASPLRRMWTARASVGRGALMVVGGTVVCAAIGMGAAKLYAAAGSGLYAPAHMVKVAAATPGASGAKAASAAPSTALTAIDFDPLSGRGSALSAVDPAQLTQHSSPVGAPGGVAAARPENDGQRAAASPIQQQGMQQAAAPSRPAHIEVEAQPQPPAATTNGTRSAATATQETASPSSQPDRSFHHAARHHVSPSHDTQSQAVDAGTTGTKPAAPTGHGSDVQLF